MTSSLTDEHIKLIRFWCLRACRMSWFIESYGKPSEHRRCLQIIDDFLLGDYLSSEQHKNAISNFETVQCGQDSRHVSSLAFEAIGVFYSLCCVVEDPDYSEIARESILCFARGLDYSTPQVGLFDMESNQQPIDKHTLARIDKVNLQDLINMSSGYFEYFDTVKNLLEMAHDRAKT